MGQVRVRVRASASQAEHLVAWEAGWPDRMGRWRARPGLGSLLAGQLQAEARRLHAATALLRVLLNVASCHCAWK